MALAESPWQDGVVTAEPLALRQVTDAATLRALSDPLRLAILRVLMAEPSRVMSVKELAAALGEPQTRLYRHVKQLEERQLIQVAETRVVSGIIEQRYRAGQRDLRLDRSLLVAPDGDADVGESALGRSVLAVLDHVRDEFAAQLRAGRIRFAATGSQGSPPTDLSTLGGLHVVKLTPEHYARFRARVRELFDEFERADESEPGATVPVSLFAMLYAEQPPEGEEQR